MGPGSNLKTLHHNQMGQIRKCKCCEEVQLMFGTYFSTMPTPIFISFAHYLDSQKEHMRTQLSSMPACQRMLINSGVAAQTHYLAVKRDEFDDLLDLVSSAAVLLEVEELLEQPK